MRGVRVSLDERPRRALGQYFTPQAVARFAVRALARLGAFSGDAPAVIDPAAGPGLFLAAVDAEVPRARTLGLDIDVGLTGSRVRLGNGLLDHPEMGVVAGAFDVVVGNPPYGGLGLGELLALSRGETSDAAWTLAEGVIGGSELLRATLPDATDDLAARRISPRLCQVLDKAFRYPVENLFLERFVRLLRPGGWMAVVVPEGVLANARAARLRAWIAERGQVAAIIGLPRVFATAGASARTAVLVYQRAPADGRAVAVADVGMEWTPRGEAAVAPTDLEAYLETPPTFDVPWSDLRQQRWDPRFWDPRFASPLDGMAECAMTSFGDVIEYMTYGPIVVGQAPSDCAGAVPVISQGQIEESGVNLALASRVQAGSVFDPPRCRVRPRDLLLPRSGAGSLGRNRLAVYDGDEAAALGCFVDVIRIRRLNPWFVWFFLKTRFGWGQIRRLINGVGMPNISFDEIRSLRIPCLDAARQDEVEARWRAEVHPAHEVLVAACARGTGAASARAEAEARTAALARRLEGWLEGR